MNEANVLYFEAHQKVLNVRHQRRQIYGDAWMGDPIDYNIWNAWGKAQRAAYILKHGSNDYEKLEDTLIDLINYALFALAQWQKIKREAPDAITENRHSQIWQKDLPQA